MSEFTSVAQLLPRNWQLRSGANHVAEVGCQVRGESHGIGVQLPRSHLQHCASGMACGGVDRRAVEPSRCPRHPSTDLLQCAITHPARAQLSSDAAAPRACATTPLSHRQLYRSPTWRTRPAAATSMIGWLPAAYV